MSTSWNAPLHEQTEQQARGVSVPHLVMGLVFLGLAGSWLLHQIGVIESVEVEWMLPLILVVAGAAGLLASMVKGLTKGRPSRPDYRADSRADDRADEETFVTDDDTP